MRDRRDIDVFYSEEDGGYIAEARDLAICSAFGATRAEALAELSCAAAAWVAAAREVGRPVPESCRRRPH